MLQKIEQWHKWESDTWEVGQADKCRYGDRAEHMCFEPELKAGRKRIVSSQITPETDKFEPAALQQIEQGRLWKGKEMTRTVIPNPVLQRVRTCPSLV